MVKKNSRPFGFEATFSASLCSESLLSWRPGFDPRRVQTLGTHSFVAPLDQIEVLLLFLKALINIHYEKHIQGGTIVFKVFYEHSKTPHFIS